VTLLVHIPGRESLRLDYLVLDLNGTLTDRGVPIEGVAERLAGLRSQLECELLSADTFGALEDVARRLGLSAHPVETGDDKVRRLVQLGADRCAVIGNGANDAGMLEAAALGIAVLGHEGAAASALSAADIVCGSILAALDLLADERALVATLRP
jgi:P-type E1-E2 ATPase